MWPSLVRVTLIRDVNCDSLKTWAIVVEPWCRAFCGLLCFGSLFIRFQVPCRCLYVFHGGRGLSYGFPGGLLLGVDLLQKQHCDRTCQGCLKPLKVCVVRDGGCELAVRIVFDQVLV